MEKSLSQSFITEMRRGNLTLLVLASLYQPHYGYELLEILQDVGVAIEANTLYPLLRRLEKQELLSSTWDTTESRPRKYYQISSLGEEIFRELLVESKKMSVSLQRIQGEDE
ncbi:PadR family transcriptional regulator [Enterococcus sp. HY326]|uniref:PadR family transcriptional regulator n=1 Tax=Enterococcus sp. HY326 TaxID=2971265 RepID=UPI0022400F14|nr:PadR family transcriptional regulator [Enterococcus sp. HY326]